MICLYGNFVLNCQMSLLPSLNTLDPESHLNEHILIQSQQVGVEQVFTNWDKGSRIK